MKTHRCCHAPTPPGSLRPISRPPRRIRAAAEWIIPGAILVAMPKCPACVAAYVALFTGVDILFSSAAHLRILMLTLCFILLAVLAARRIRSIW